MHPLTGLMSALGHGPGLLARREACAVSRPVVNKIRQLAALLGDALAQRATVVLTTGACSRTTERSPTTAITAAMHVFQV